MLPVRLILVNVCDLPATVFVLCMQGFMQDQIIASHTCFGGNVVVYC